MEGPLGKLLPPEGATDDAILDAFMAYVEQAGLTLYPAQEEAILELYAGKNVILNTPTGSGKSLVALAMHFRALARGERAFYTSPIKALASEKFFDLARELSPNWIGMMTGDASVNRDAGVICCTAEILANIGLSEGKYADVDAVVMDEFHYYSDKDRGVAWQLPLLTLPQAQFLLMSATLGDTQAFVTVLSELTGRDTVVVKGTERPVPLDFTYADTLLQETVAHLAKHEKTPVYLVNFSQRSAAEEAQNLMSLDLCTKEEKKRIATAMSGINLTSPYGKELARFLRHGIGIHHAGLLPKYRRLVEKLAQEGLLKVISGTDTLGVGVNIPIRTVLFTKLCKYDGEKTALLSARDFHQIAGRAGRRGFDTAGSVVAQAPAHVIENQRLESKANSATGGKKKFVRRKPPERGYVAWDDKVFTGLQSKEPEPLVSRFTVTHGMVIETLLREGSGCLSLGRIIKRSHERPADKRKHGKAAQEIIRSLVTAGVIVRAGNRFVLADGFSRDFSMHHTLTLWLLATLPQVHGQSEVFALDALSLVEAILENPELLLQKQVDKLKTEKMAEMKRDGVEYDERIAELEKVSYPKPLEEFIYGTFNEFTKLHPWARLENIRPKGIAREMVESFLSFNDMIREYGLERSEGLLLRYLNDVHRTLAAVIPEGLMTPELKEVELYLAAMLRQTDSSLLEEWERMRSGEARVPTRPEAAKEIEKTNIVQNAREFAVLVRNQVFSLVRAIARRDFALCVELQGATEADAPAWSAAQWEGAARPYFEAYGTPRTDVAARGVELFSLTKNPDMWEGFLTLLDAEDSRAWLISFRVNLAASAERGRVVLADVALRPNAL